MRQYLQAVQHVLDNGKEVKGRNGMTLEVFGLVMQFDLGAGFPLVTTKKMPTKVVLGELFAFLEGATSLKQFHAHRCHIWDANANADYWAKADGDYLGHIYGAQWRAWRKPNGETVDQMQDLIDGIKSNPTGRRHVVTALNPGEFDDMCLPPCHLMFQVHIDESTNELNMLINQRSADMMLGIPFDLASYGFLMHMLAHQTGRVPGKMTYVLGSAHIYEDHIAGAKEQASRLPFPLPYITMAKPLADTPDKKIEEYTIDDFVLPGENANGCKLLREYNSHPSIKFKMSV